MEARMEAMREFALADPEDCDREWSAYLALVSGKEAASDYSPTNSTSSLSPAATTKISPAASASACPRVPRNAAPIVNPTATAVSRAVLNAEHDSPKDDLSPGARRIYDLIIGGSSTPTSTAPLHVQSSAVPIDGISKREAATPSPTSAPASMDDLSPEARRIYDYLVGNSAAPPTTVVSTNLDNTDLTAPTPTICLAECPSKDAPAPVSVIILSTTSNSSTIICNAVPEQAAPAVSDKVFDVDAMGDTSISAAVCLPAGPDHNICGEDLVSKSQTLWSAPTPFSLLPGNPPSSTCEPMDVLEPFLGSSTCSTDSSCRSIKTIAPWPPPSYTCAGTSLVYGHELCSDVQQKLGEKFSIVQVIQSSLPPPVQDFRSQRKQSAIWLEVREDRQPCEKREMVKLKPPWPSLAMHMNLLMANAILDVSSWPWTTSKQAVVQFQCTDNSWSTYLKFEQLQNVMGALLEMKWWPSWLFDLEYSDGGNTFKTVPRNMTLTGVSAVVGRLKTVILIGVTIRNGCNASLDPDPCIFSKVFMEGYSVFAVFRSLFVVVMCDEALLWLIFQSATVNTNLLLPWDPGQPWYGGDSKLGTVEYGLLVMLSTATGVAYFQRNSILCHHPPPAKTPDKSNYIFADKRKVLVLHTSAGGTSADILGNSYYLIIHNQKVQTELSILVAFSPAPNLQKMQFIEKSGQCSGFLILMSKGAICYNFACFAWKIAWLLVGTSCACSDLEGSEHVTSKSRPPDILLQDWLTCLMGHIIQCSFDLVQWKIAWSFIWESFEITSTNPTELLLLHVGKIFQASFIVFCCWLGGVAAWFYTNTSFKRARTYLMVDMKHNIKDMNSWDYPIQSADCLQLNLNCSFPMVYLLRGYRGIRALQLPWDPGDRFSSAWRLGNLAGVNNAYANRGIDTSQVPRDPGGLEQHRLGGKPKFKKGGLSATYLLGWLTGRHSWAKACSGDTQGWNRGGYIPSGQLRGDLAKNEPERAASAEARVARVACACSSPSPRSILILQCSSEIEACNRI